MMSIRESFNKEQAHRLLTENNFFCDEDLWDVLDYADDDAYKYIYNNRANYASYIHYLLEPTDFVPPRSKMIVREMTDKDMKDMEAEQTSAKKREFDHLWISIEKTIGDRPYDDIDKMHDDAWDALQNVRTRMTAYLSKKNAKYVPPSARSSTDPVFDKLDKELDECKRVYEEIEKQVEEADKKYLADKKDEHYQKWLLSVQVETVVISENLAKE